MLMNNSDWLVPRRRRQNLLIVEGHHEKNKLMKLLLQIYQEIDISIDDIIIYGTNIYLLYAEIEKEYGEMWTEVDVDLPYIVSKQKGYSVSLNKNDFMNILIIFDYERHDPNFSEEKISAMQRYFNDVADVGKLCINYPMIESYQHLFSIPDSAYAERRVSRLLQPGTKYKALVKGTVIAKMINLPDKIKEILNKRFSVDNIEICNNCVEHILQIGTTDTGVKEAVRDILENILEEEKLLTAENQIEVLIRISGYAYNGKNYYEHMREIFNGIIIQNICKANKILSGEYDIPEEDMESYFNGLDYLKILQKQNESSRDEMEGIIWVLNTSVFFVPDYNFNLVQNGIQY